MSLRRALLCLMLAAAPAAAQQAETGGAPTDLPAPPGVPPLAPPPSLPTGTIAAPDTAADTATGGAPVLTLDLDLLYLSSAWGLRAQARLEAEGDIVAAENERLTRLLSAEETQLTEQRATLPAAQFRQLAESFDLRATGIRRERAQAVQDLNGWAEADRAAFFRAALPVMGQVMTDRGAVAVLDRRTVFVSLDAIDVTQQLITTLDQRIGDGADVVPLPTPDAPLTEATVSPEQTGDSGQAGDAVPDQVE